MLRLMALVSEGVSRYAKIVYLPPNPAFLQADGLRPTNAEFQRAIAERVEAVLAEFGLQDRIVRVNPLNATPEDLKSVVAPLHSPAAHFGLGQSLRASEVMDVLLNERTVNAGELVGQLITFVRGNGFNNTRRVQMDTRLPDGIVALLRSGGFVV